MEKFNQHETVNKPQRICKYCVFAIVDTNTISRLYCKNENIIAQRLEKLKQTKIDELKHTLKIKLTEEMKQDVEYEIKRLNQMIRVKFCDSCRCFKYNDFIKKKYEQKA